MFERAYPRNGRKLWCSLKLIQLDAQIKHSVFEIKTIK